MKEQKLLSLDEIRAFLEASEEIGFEGKHRKEIYAWVQQTLVEQQYHSQGKAAKGLLHRYVEKMTGLSHSQVTRLIRQHLQTGNVTAKAYLRRSFPRRYSRADIELLAKVDEAHETLSGPATQKILYREYHDYGNSEYERLAAISVAHLYNLRHSVSYRQRHLNYRKTKATGVPIGSGVSRIHRAGRGTCGWIRSIKVTQRESRGCTTSMP